jgi:hypothetical protein
METMMRKDLWLPILALSIYIIGGLATFVGIGMILLLKGRDLLGLGEGRSLGYLFLCVGLGFSILGVLIMRIVRNRY